MSVDAGEITMSEGWIVAENFVVDVIDIYQQPGLVKGGMEILKCALVAEQLYLLSLSQSE